MSNATQKRRFAEGTEITVKKSKTEIEKLLSRYGATGFEYRTKDHRAIIGFEMQTRYIRFLLVLPAQDDPGFERTPGGAWRTENQKTQAREQETRRRWRCLVMLIKAKLESVESGIVTLEEEFLAQTVMPNDQTVGQWLQEELRNGLKTGQMPALPPGSPLLLAGEQARYE